MKWRTDDAPRDGRALLIKAAACMSVAVWSDEWKGWLCHADGFDARDHHGEHIVVAEIDAWFDPDQLNN